MSAPSAHPSLQQPKPNSVEVSVRSSRDFEAEVANANWLTGQGANRLQNALTALGEAMREVNGAIEEMRSEHDRWRRTFSPRAAFTKKSDTKSGKRHHLSARLGWQQACDLGFRGDLESGNGFRGSSSASLKAAPAARPMRPSVLLPKIHGRFLRSRIFAAKLRNPAKPSANTCASGPL